jgi:DNA-directed RNA polymerase sigma subunit (sigma70/sigma32)
MHDHHKERGGLTFDEIADRLFREGLTRRRFSRERVRQLESESLAKLKRALEAAGFDAVEAMRFFSDATVGPGG